METAQKFALRGQQFEVLLSLCLVAVERAQPNGILSSRHFLVARYATLHPAVSVRRSVGWSVGRSPFYFFGVFELFKHTAPAQIP